MLSTTVVDKALLGDCLKVLVKHVTHNLATSSHFIDKMHDNSTLLNAITEPSAKLEQDRNATVPPSLDKLIHENTRLVLLQYHFLSGIAQFRIPSRQITVRICQSIIINPLQKVVLVLLRESLLFLMHHNPAVGSSG